MSEQNFSLLFELNYIAHANVFFSKIVGKSKERRQRRRSTQYEHFIEAAAVRDRGGCRFFPYMQNTRHHLIKQDKVISCLALGVGAASGQNYINSVNGLLFIYYFVMA